MRKTRFKIIVSLVGIMMLFLTTGASAQIKSVVLSGSVTPGTRVVAKDEGTVLGSSEMKVTVTGGVVLNTVYVWKKNGVVIPNAPNAANYSIAPVTPADAGTYTCTVTRANSSTDPTLSTMDADSVAILQVKASTSAPAGTPLYRSGVRPPFVVYAPGTVTNIAQSNLGQTLGKITALDTSGLGYLIPAVNPNGKASSVRWFRNGVEINVNTPGFTAADFTWASNQGPSLQLTVSNTAVSTTANGDEYYCIFGNSVGSATTTKFNVAIVGSTAVPVFTKVENVDAPADIATVIYDTLFIGSTQDFVGVSANNALSYQWYKGIAPNGVAISGANGAIYSPSKGWTAADAGTYYVKAINGAYTDNAAPSALSNPIQIAVVDGKGITADLPTGNTTPTEMDTLKLSAHTKGIKLFANQYKWYRNGQVLPTESTSELSLEYMSISDTGSYNYVVRNEVDSAVSGTVKVTLGAREPLPMFVNLADVYDGVNNVVNIRMTLLVKGVGSDDLTIWSVIDNRGVGVEPMTYTPGGRYSRYLYSTTTNTAFPAGKYTVRVTNADGSVILEKAVEIK